jgi:hypothetical protein
VIRTLLPARRSAAALIVATCAVLGIAAAGAGAAQNAAEISVDPSSGAPGSQFNITLKNYHACAADSPNCIVIDFVQGSNKTRIGTADSKGSPTFTGGPLTVPPSAVAGSATVHAFSSTDDASTGFTVTGAAAATTTTAAATTTVPTTTSTTVAPTTTITTIVPPLTEPSTTTTTLATKKTSSHSDVPRYIAVALVVLAAAATAGVDTRLRHLRGPTGGAGPPEAL